MALPVLLPALALAASLAAGAWAEQDGSGFTFKGRAWLRVTAAPSGDGGSAVFESDPASGEFTSVVFQGLCRSGGGIGVEVSVRRGGAWGEWSAADLEFFKRGRFVGRADVSGARGDSLRLRVRRPPGGTVEFFEIEGASLSGEEPIAVRRAASPRAAPPEAAPQPAVVERGEWGAARPGAPFEPMAPDLITVHHTAGELLTDPGESLEEMRVIQRYHQRGRRWKDIAYHFVIDGGGRVYRGRPLNVVGSHVRDNNEANIGVSLMGNFSGKVSPTEAQLASLAVLLRWLSRSLGVPPEKIFGHRDQNPKTICPGPNLYLCLTRLREAAGEPVPPGGGKGMLDRAALRRMMGVAFGRIP
jgi:hypothetical protein